MFAKGNSPNIASLVNTLHSTWNKTFLSNTFMIDKQMLHRLLNEVCCKGGESRVYDKRNEEHECREAGDCDNGQREGGVELQLGLHWDDILRKYTFLMQH